MTLESVTMNRAYLGKEFCMEWCGGWTEQRSRQTKQYVQRPQRKRDYGSFEDLKVVQSRIERRD